MKIAIIHDWLVTWGGSELVLAELLSIYPQADLFASIDFLSPTDRLRLGRQKIATTFIQNLPFSRRHYRKYLGLMPLAFEQLDLRGYDLIISSSHSVAKSVLTGPDQLHLCLCYSPPRYAWDLQTEYLQQSGLERGVLGWIARFMLHRLRIADTRASLNVDQFVAISQYIAKRIQKCYRRDSIVIYPPVDMPTSIPEQSRGLDYVTVTRLVPYKRVDLLIQAFQEFPERILHVIGDGPEMSKLARIAGTNIVFHGALSNAERDQLMDSSAAFLYAAEEDFGIAPIEAQGRGLPVIAYKRGGTGETIRCRPAEAPTGILFETQSAAAIADAIRRFEQNRELFPAGACRANALRFSKSRFRFEFAAFVESSWQKFHAERGK